jgi:hypothetical protein
VDCDDLAWNVSIIHFCYVSKHFIEEMDTNNIYNNKIINKVLFNRTLIETLIRCFRMHDKMTSSTKEFHWRIHVSSEKGIGQ